MNIVIPYTDDGADGYELKYAIRSMVKHYLHMTGVLLIGDKPTWYTGDHIPFKDIHGRKEWSIVTKILQAPYGHFLLSNDDIMAQHDFDTLPLYHAGPIPGYPAYDLYLERRNNVHALFPDGLFYDVHTPMPVIREIYHECQPDDWDKKEYLQKSIYGNTIGGGELIYDNKLRGVHPGFKIDPSHPFFSTSNRTVKFLPLQEMFPKPSRYER
jgi:hypothetical protein